MVREPCVANFLVLFFFSALARNDTQTFLLLSRRLSQLTRMETATFLSLSVWTTRKRQAWKHAGNMLTTYCTARYTKINQLPVAFKYRFSRNVVQTHQESSLLSVGTLLRPQPKACSFHMPDGFHSMHAPYGAPTSGKRSQQPWNFNFNQTNPSCLSCMHAYAENLEGTYGHLPVKTFRRIAMHTISPEEDPAVQRHPTDPWKR